MAKSNVYYLVEANDGVVVSNKIKTLKEAKAIKKSLIDEDADEFGLNEGDIEYSIIKYTEIGDTKYWEEI